MSRASWRSGIQSRNNHEDESSEDETEHRADDTFYDVD
jgi:hypothetical protein